MKYYVTADTHGFFTSLHTALSNAGFFTDREPHKLVILGDLFDRGMEALKLQAFILERMEKDEVILIRGNHEDLMEIFVEEGAVPYDTHIRNGTFSTALQLTGFSSGKAIVNPEEFAAAIKETPFYKTIMPAMLNYYETGHYIFTHGWIPCDCEARGQYCAYSDWRSSDENEWKKARWYNGLLAAQTVTEDDKTICCGHWHTSFGHSVLEGKGSEFGEDADFSPYTAPGIIALDACTALSGFVNCIVIEDQAL